MSKLTLEEATVNALCGNLTETVFGRKPIMKNTETGETISKRDMRASYKSHLKADTSKNSKNYPYKQYVKDVQDNLGYENIKSKKEEAEKDDGIKTVASNSKYEILMDVDNLNKDVTFTYQYVDTDVPNELGVPMVTVDNFNEKEVGTTTIKNVTINWPTWDEVPIEEAEHFIEVLKDAIDVAKQVKGKDFSDMIN